jgi:quinol monooxygenase YgiN
MSDTSFGALIQLTAREGMREELLRVLRNYTNTLDGEPGTVLYAVAADPGDENMVWIWEQFADSAAVQAHFAHDFFRALQFELEELLVESPGIRPLAPVVTRVQAVAAE